MAARHDRLLDALGRGVRERRLARGLSLRDLARTAGLSERFLGQVEAGTGNISVRKLQALAEALGARAADLLADAPKPTPTGVVALLGLRGAGKTTVGRRLAQRLRAPFVELDRLVEAHAGLPLAEIFRLHGEGYYRAAERRALEQVLGEPGPKVVATGGGLVTSSETYARLRQDAVTVWLRARAEEHWARVVGQGDRRPMEARPQAMAELRRLLASREPLYAQATFTVDTSRLSVDRAVAAIERGLSRAGAGRRRPRPVNGGSSAPSGAAPGRAGRGARRTPSPD
jgi:XRE family aerobic/anaerobic benzoate catabolism transcriptional regulator